VFVIVYAAENQNRPKFPALLGIGLSGNPAVTTLDALAPYTGASGDRLRIKLTFWQHCATLMP
jgi:hypothetical protein